MTSMNTALCWLFLNKVWKVRKIFRVFCEMQIIFSIVTKCHAHEKFKFQYAVDEHNVLLVISWTKFEKSKVFFLRFWLFSIKHQTYASLTTNLICMKQTAFYQMSKFQD